MKNLLISGISGKVGLHLKNLANKYGFNVICGVDKNTFIEANFPVYKTFLDVKEQIDIIIDFSASSLTENALDFAYENNCKFVCGTTALSRNAMQKIQILAQQNAVCLAANFSIAMPVYTMAVKLLNENLIDFDCNITEVHSILKKDAPSGTAKEIAKQTDIKNISSIRGGNCAGVHRTIFLGTGEEIEIIHRAYDKSIFAVGALKCALKLLQKEKGLFSPCDLA